MGPYIGPPHIPITLLNIFCFLPHVIRGDEGVGLTMAWQTLAWREWQSPR